MESGDICRSRPLLLITLQEGLFCLAVRAAANPHGPLHFTVFVAETVSAIGLLGALLSLVVND